MKVTLTVSNPCPWRAGDNIVIGSGEHWLLMHVEGCTLTVRPNRWWWRLVQKLGMLADAFWQLPPRCLS